MPIYEFFCPNCNNVFEKLYPMDRVSEAVQCELCGLDGERLMSRFAYRHATTYYQKIQEKKDESLHRADCRMDADPLLNPVNWLNKVKKERETEKAFKKDVIARFGKEPDAPNKYVAQMEMAHRIKTEDRWSNS